MAFKEQLESGLALHNMTPLQLAAELERRGQAVTVGTVQRWLDGSNEPRFGTAEQVLAILADTAAEANSDGCK